MKPFSGIALRIDEELDLFSEALSKCEFEKAAHYLETANKLSELWKEARDSYIEALELFPTREYARIIPLLEKAQEKYEKVGDEEFSERLTKLIRAFSILQESIQFLENNNYEEGEEHLVDAQKLFEELGEREYVNYIEDLILFCQRGRKLQIIIYAVVSLIVLSGLTIYLRRR